MPLDPTYASDTLARHVMPVSESESVPTDIDNLDELVAAMQGSAKPSSKEDAGPLHRKVRRINQDRSSWTLVSPCPVCDGQRAYPAFAIDGMTSEVVTCRNCGLGRLEPQPSPDAIRSFYPSKYYGGTGSKFEPMVENMVRWVGARHARLLSRGLRPGARVLDVGCGRGVTLSALADRGFEVHGVEISEDAAQGADPRAKIRIAPRLSEAKYFECYFDQVVMWHVLEHVPDPRETLKEIHRIVKPGGRVVIAVPNFSSLQARWAGESWFHLDLPRHLFHFPLDALERMLERNGFAFEACHHFSLRQNPFGWVQSALNRWGGASRNRLYEMLHARSESSEDFDSSERSRLRLAYSLGMPLGLAASFVETCCRSGATVTVVARRA